MNTKTKKILVTVGIIAILAVSLFAINCLCAAVVMWLVNGILALLGSIYRIGFWYMFGLTFFLYLIRIFVDWGTVVVHWKNLIEKIKSYIDKVS